MWVTLAIFLLGGAAVWYGALEARKRLQTWRDTVASCGLRIVEASGVWQPWLEARAGWVGVRIKASGDKGQTTQIMVVAPGPPDFHMVRIRPGSLFQWAREIEIGDESFDKTFFIEGPTGLVLALLDAETRRLLLRLSIESQLEISDGALQAEMADEKVSAVLPLLLDLGQRFAQPMDIPRRLAENVQQDPETGVKLQNLLLLIREFPEDPRAVEALRTACSHPNPEIRLRVARQLGAAGRGVLLELAESLVDDTVSAEAVSILDRELPFERARAILDHARRARRIQTAHACLKVLGRSGAAAAVDVLAKVLAIEKGEMAAVAAQALGETGDPTAEPPLILALRREEEGLRVAAANALGRVGSPAAVLPLKEAAERFWLDLGLSRAARQAIAEIQSRLQGASPGQLSLAGAEAGQLSLAEADAGQLSFANHSDGQLSLSGAEDPQEKV